MLAGSTVFCSEVLPVLAGEGLGGAVGEVPGVSSSGAVRLFLGRVVAGGSVGLGGAVLWLEALSSELAPYSVPLECFTASSPSTVRFRDPSRCRRNSLRTLKAWAIESIPDTNIRSNAGPPSVAEACALERITSSVRGIKYTNPQKTHLLCPARKPI